MVLADVWQLSRFEGQQLLAFKKRSTTLVQPTLSPSWQEKEESRGNTGPSDLPQKPLEASASRSLVRLANSQVQGRLGRYLGPWLHIEVSVNKSGEDAEPAQR